MDIKFERATPADAEALLALQIRAFNDDARIYPGVKVGGPPGYDSIDEMINSLGKVKFHKIVCDGQIVGGLSVFDKGQGWFHLDRLYIDPDFHNRGIGTRAMHFIEETYPATKWTLDTPTFAVRNHHFYEKLGYVKVAEFPADGITLIAYEKQIGSPK